MPKKQQRRRYSKRSNSTASKANRALYLAKKAIHQETKFIDTVYAPTLVPNSGLLMTSPCAVSAGVNYNNRIGNVIQATSLHLRGVIQMNGTAVATRVRVIIFRNNLSGNPGAVIDYLNTNDINSMKSTDNRYNTQTLMDRTYLVDLENIKKPLNIKLKLNKPIYYGQTGSVPEKFGVFLMAISDEPTNTPTISWTSRLFFKE